MKNIFILSALMFITGCFADMDFERPEIVSVSPSHNSTLIPRDSAVVVEFSKAMDTVKTNNEFSLSGENGNVNGTFAWIDGDRKLIFTPRGEFSPEKFTLRITKGAEDKDGNDLKNEFVSVFYIRGENVSPAVSSYSPGANTIGNPRDASVVINFSEPVNLNTIYGGITVTPSIQGYYVWNAGTDDSATITFTPLYGFDYGVTYTVGVSDSILDISGNKLRDPVTFSFTVGDDFTKPELDVSQDLTPPLDFDESHITHGAEKNRRIILRFSEIINTDNLRNAVTISPSAVTYISSEITGGVTTAYINFTENLLPAETYTLRISSSITDLQNNSLISDYRYVFVTDGANSLPPVVSEIGNQNPVIPRWVKGDIEMLALQALPLNPLLYPDIVVDFNHEINPYSLLIHAETAAGTGGSPTVVNIDWPDGPPAKFTRLKFALYNVQSGNIYKIVIKGGKNGLRDMNGNFMKNDFVQMVQF